MTICSLSFYMGYVCHHHPTYAPANFQLQHLLLSSPLHPLCVLCWCPCKRELSTWDSVRDMTGTPPPPQLRGAQDTAVLYPSPQPVCVCVTGVESLECHYCTVYYCAVCVCVYHWCRVSVCHYCAVCVSLAKLSA